MVSEQNGTSHQPSRCLWENCPKSSNPYETPEQLLDHVFEDHIPTTIKNEDGEEEVICEWDNCEMGTTRGTLEKKTEWMRTHIKTRHITSAKTFKCMIENCNVITATNRELESHVRVAHLTSPKKVKTPKPESEEEEEGDNVWKVVNGRVTWIEPEKVKEETTISHDDGERIVFPKGHERDNDSEWEWRFKYPELFKEGPVRKPTICSQPRPGERGPWVWINQDWEWIRKKKAELRIREEREAAAKAKKEERKKQQEEARQRKLEIKLAKQKAASKPRLDVNENLIMDSSDEFDSMPSLKAYFEDSEPEAEIIQAPKTEKKIAFKATAPSPVKSAPVERAFPVKKEAPKTKTVEKILKPIGLRSSVVAKKSSNSADPVTTSSPVKTLVKRALKVSSETKPSSAPKPIAKPVSIAPKPKVKPVSKPIVVARKRKLKIIKRPSRACRVLGSMEEVPFEIEIEVEFEKPKKLKSC